MHNYRPHCFRRRQHCNVYLSPSATRWSTTREDLAMVLEPLLKISRCFSHHTRSTTVPRHQPRGEVLEIWGAVSNAHTCKHDGYAIGGTAGTEGSTIPDGRAAYGAAPLHQGEARGRSSRVQGPAVGTAVKETLLVAVVENACPQEVDGCWVSVLHDSKTRAHGAWTTRGVAAG